VGDRGKRFAYLRSELAAAWTGPTFDADRAHRAMVALREELKAMGIKEDNRPQRIGRRRKRRLTAPASK
jgi:hypothetical protein